jgi:hypothetical protein
LQAVASEHVHRLPLVRAPANVNETVEHVAERTRVVERSHALEEYPRLVGRPRMALGSAAKVGDLGAGGVELGAQGLGRLAAGLHHAAGVVGAATHVVEVALYGCETFAQRALGIFELRLRGTTRLLEIGVRPAASLRGGRVGSLTSCLLTRRDRLSIQPIRKRAESRFERRAQLTEHVLHRGVQAFL